MGDHTGITFAILGRVPAAVALRYVIHPEGSIDDLKSEDFPKALPVPHGHLCHQALRDA